MQGFFFTRKSSIVRCYPGAAFRKNSWEPARNWPERIGGFGGQSIQPYHKRFQHNQLLESVLQHARAICEFVFDPIKPRKKEKKPPDVRAFHLTDNTTAYGRAAQSIRSTWLMAWPRAKRVVIR